MISNEKLLELRDGSPYAYVREIAGELFEARNELTELADWRRSIGRGEIFPDLLRRYWRFAQDESPEKEG